MPKKAGKKKAAKKKEETKEQGKKIEKGEKPATVEGLIAALNAKAGTRVISKYGDIGKEKVARISTGSLLFDNLIGGGFPRGRITEIYGPESAGKTALSASAMASAQKSGGRAALVDFEHAFDITLAERTHGLKGDELLMSQPETAEQGAGVIRDLVSSGLVDIVVVDSVAAMVPQAELEAESGDSAGLGVHARLMSQLMRQITGEAKRTNTAVVFINQIRHKIGVMFGSPETTPGGNALKFYATLRLKMFRGSPIKIGELPVGQTFKILLEKNKLGVAKLSVETDFHYENGFSPEKELIQVGVAAGILDKAGAFIKFEGKMVGQGVDNAAQKLREDPELRALILQKVEEINA